MRGRARVRNALKYFRQAERRRVFQGWLRGDARLARRYARRWSCARPLRSRCARRSGYVTLVVDKLLALANYTEKAVVDDGDVHFDFFLNDRRQFAHGHLEATIADHDPYVGLRLGELCADRSGQREAHGAEAARGDQSARTIVMVILRFPHLMLAHV